MAKKKKKKRVPVFKWLVLLVLVCVFTYTMLEIRNKSSVTQTANPNVNSDVSSVNTYSGIYPQATEDTFAFTDEAGCKNGILIDLQTNTIVSQRKADQIIYPASLTKIMTLLVAVENTNDLNDTYTMTFDILDALYQEEASMAGFGVDEQCKIIDLLYGAILPSGADATTALANYVSGSEPAFVELMNQKAKELGLKNTHFTNASGLHNENHYSTVTDIALILKTALKNDLCRKILSAYQYTTSASEQNPEGILLTSTLLGRMYGDEVAGMTIEGGKTGFTLESGHSVATFGKINSNGNEYILVLASGADKWIPIYDCFTVYGYISDKYNLSGTTSEEVSETESESQNSKSNSESSAPSESKDTETTVTTTVARTTESHMNYYDYIKQKKSNKDSES